jgi:hypothetical protein
MFNTKNNLVLIIYILYNFIILTTFHNKNEVLFIIVAECNIISSFNFAIYLSYIIIIIIE